MVMTSSIPPESMRKTAIPSMIVKRKGKEGWMFFSPTTGIYQSKKMKRKRIRQVTTRSPIKILFFGCFSKSTSNNEFGVT
jgi:hypothetical protein